MSTMDCADIKALLSGLIDDELDQETRHLAERHLGGCKNCRTLIDEAESLDKMICLDAEMDSQGASLPAGFEEAVLREIAAPVFNVPYLHRWSTWVGWAAAAASLALALTIWVTDRSTFIQQQETPAVAHQTPIESLMLAGDDPWIAGEEYTPSFEPRPPRTINTVYTRPVFGNLMAPSADTFALYASPMTSDEQSPAPPEAEVTEIVKEIPSKASPLITPPSISESNSQTLFAASLLLEMIAEADMTSFKDIEMARRILEYDQLLPRLAATRATLAPEDRPAVFASEAILIRISEGPFDLNDLRELCQTVEQMNLAQRLNALSRRGRSA